MRWYDIVSILSESKIRLLIIVVVIFIIIALAVTFIEYRLKKKRILVENKKEGFSYVNRARRVINSDKNPREKLKEFDLIVKSYLKDNFNVPLNSSYSYLRDYFKKSQNDNLAEFSQRMFDIYYASENVNDSKLKAAFVDFAKLVKNLSANSTEPVDRKRFFDINLLVKKKKENKRDKSFKRENSNIKKNTLGSSLEVYPDVKKTKGRDLLKKLKKKSKI